MNKLIEKIEAEIKRCDDASYNTLYLDGLCAAIDILRSTPGLWLEEITEEEAKNPNPYASCKPCYSIIDENLEMIGWSKYYNKWLRWRDIVTDRLGGSGLKPTKFYRLPQAKETKNDQPK